MLPWWHLATSLLVSYSLVTLLGLNFSTGLKWIVVGCAAGTLIDLDHLLYVLLVFKDKWWKYVKFGIEDPKGLMLKFQKKGTLASHAHKRMILHTLTMLSIYTISLYVFPSYSLVIGLVFIVHLLLDIEPRWLLV
jgi:hypothetical protein